MAVVVSKSFQLTQRDASPRVAVSTALENAFLRESAALVLAVSGDSINSIYRFVQVPSNCRISQILLTCDDLGTTTACNIGIWDTVDNGGVVVNATLFASALALNAGPYAVDVTHQSTVYGANDVEKLLWQALGLASDPGKAYDVCAILTAACNGSGNMALKVRYVI